MKKKILLIAAAIVAIALAILGVAAFSIFGPNTKNTKEVQITVPRDATYAQVQDTLRAHDLLQNGKTFDAVVKAMKFKTMRCGHYTISPKMSNFDLVRLLRAGQHYPVKFAFNNARTIDQFVSKVGHHFFFEPEELRALLSDSTVMVKYGFNAATIPAMFIPNSYEFYYDISAEGFLDKMYSIYQNFWNEQRKAKAQEIGLSPIEVATLASIVEEENFRSDEKPIIAGLYINRLHKGMLLQADPTVKFAIGDFARKRILNSDLQIDSPYNTYKYPGLPPGPIRIPDGSTLDAVLNYTHHDYLFMCAKEDFSGYHNFTASAGQHAQNAARYRAALNKRNIKH